VGAVNLLDGYFTSPIQARSADLPILKLSLDNSCDFATPARSLLSGISPPDYGLQNGQSADSPILELSPKDLSNFSTPAWSLLSGLSSPDDSLQYGFPALNTDLAKLIDALDWVLSPLELKERFGKLIDINPQSIMDFLCKHGAFGYIYTPFILMPFSPDQHMKFGYPGSAQIPQGYP